MPINGKPHTTIYVPNPPGFNAASRVQSRTQRQNQVNTMVGNVLDKWDPTSLLRGMR